MIIFKKNKEWNRKKNKNDLLFSISCFGGLLYVRVSLDRTIVSHVLLILTGLSGALVLFFSIRTPKLIKAYKLATQIFPGWCYHGTRCCKSFIWKRSFRSVLIIPSYFAFFCYSFTLFRFYSEHYFNADNLISRQDKDFHLWFRYDLAYLTVVTY